MPLAAATMALILLVYTRTSIGAAKVNARIHREADGGQISWRNESLRQHGQMDRPKEKKGILAEAIDKASTGRQTPREDGGKEIAREVGGEEERVRERARGG